MTKRNRNRGDGATPGKPPPGDRMLACLGMTDLTPSEAKVLAVIAWHDGNGKAWPSIERIAALAGGMRRSTACGHRDELRRKGRLSWRKGQLGSIYTVHYGDSFHRQEIPDDGSGRAGIPSSGNSDSRRQEIPESHRQEIPDGNGVEPTRNPREAAAASEGAAARAKGIPPEHRAKIVELGMLKPRADDPPQQEERNDD